MARKCYVMIDGRLHEKIGDNACIIDGQNWYRFGGTWIAADAPAAKTFLLMPDIKPYQSMIDGSVIGSRSAHREHLREHNCFEVGNERPTPPKQEFTAVKGLREELAARLYG